ncbi:MAG: PIN domain-containing protein [Oscillospiraceae bacterium]|jgi:predicted nucleic acid-binding protein|nr:PIN domain-containing protein [Oscillospiraceae bacterium]
MKAVFDSNVILDVLLNRKPFVDFSAKALALAETGVVTGCVTSSMVTDLYYILYRSLRDSVQVRRLILRLLDIIVIIDTTGKDVRKAFALPMADYEDALVAQCAKRAKAQCIVTRNVADFSGSPVSANLPEDFIRLYAP